jgi:hypothetical protein
MSTVMACVQKLIALELEDTSMCCVRSSSRASQQAVLCPLGLVWLIPFAEGSLGEAPSLRSCAHAAL